MPGTRCPVCRNRALPTSNDNIFRHRDKANNLCPASGAPIYICEEIPCTK